jgi:hypothetical protein
VGQGSWTVTQLVVLQVYLTEPENQQSGIPKEITVALDIVVRGWPAPAGRIL